MDYGYTCGFTPERKWPSPSPTTTIHPAFTTILCHQKKPSCEAEGSSAIVVNRSKELQMVCLKMTGPPNGWSALGFTSSYSNCSRPRKQQRFKTGQNRSFTQKGARAQTHCPKDALLLCLRHLRTTGPPRSSILPTTAAACSPLSQA